ncbi:unnamed protein product [Albugo candida]|uniref:Uncharacterized protein n=1 Tax=Albugo candida TaxID=65357 RepID=A0A024FTH5_9STRA|nr:unnamed protein product [Albugo candida]|eukprot:CCI10326.1 unnamed protein product [Albugo candida]
MGARRDTSIAQNEPKRFTLDSKSAVDSIHHIAHWKSPYTVHANEKQLISKTREQKPMHQVRSVLIQSIKDKMRRGRKLPFRIILSLNFDAFIARSKGKLVLHCSIA